MSKKILLVLMSLVLLVPAASNAALHTKTWMTNDAQDMVTVHVRCWNKTGGPAPDSLTVYKRYGYYTVGNRWSNIFGWDSVPGAIGAQARDPDSTSGITISYLAGHYDVLQKPVSAKVRVNNGAYTIMEAENHTTLNNPTPTITYSSPTWTPGVTADGRLIVNAQVNTNVASRIQLRLSYGGVLKYTALTTGNTVHNISFETGMASRGDNVTVDFRAYNATVISYSTGTFGTQATTLATQTPVISSASLVSLCNSFAGGTMATSSAFSTPINFRWRRLGTSTWSGSGSDANINTTHNSFLSHYETCAVASGYLYEFQMQLVFHDASTSVWFPIGSFPWFAVAPSSNFTATPTSGVAPLTVNFTDTSTNGPTSWAWQFGDGISSTSQNTSHVYTTAGTYTVTLTTTNSVGSDPEVKSGLITVTSDGGVDPVVSGITDVNGGSIVHGDVLTIAGLNFGTKTTATPTIYDNMETGDFSPLWASTTALTVVESPVDVKRHANDNYVAMMNFRGNLSGAPSGVTGDERAFGALQDDVRSQYLFAQYWFRLKEWEWGTTGPSGSNSSLANVKIFRLYGPPWLDNFVTATEFWSGGTAIIVKQDCFANCDINQAVIPISSYYQGGANTLFNNGQWHQLQLEYKDATLIGGTDSSVRIWVDGGLAFSRSGFVTKLCSQSGFPMMEQIGFFDSWPDGTTDDNLFYMDDVYYDTSFARVEIGDSSTFSACTHREIQIPTAWANGSVSITANLGSFASASGKFLFVTDSAGHTSAGFPIP